MPNIPTPQDVQLFAQSVKKWQQVLSLGGFVMEELVGDGINAIPEVVISQL